MHDHVPQPSDAGPGPDPREVRELLVLRPGGLRDVVRAVPALRHLRAAFPDARISVAAHRHASDLLRDCPSVDRVLDLARPSEALVESFDVAVSFANPGDSSLSVDAVHAAFRAGWSALGEPHRGGMRPRWPARLDETTRMLRLAWLLGGTMQLDGSLGLWPSLADRNGAARLVADVTRPLALVHVGGGSARRRWSDAGWTRVVDRLESIGLDPVLVGGSGDVARADAVASAARHAPLTLVGRTSVGELVGLLERAALFVGPDSGPAALAEAVGVRSVVIGPASTLEHVVRPGLVDIVDSGPCPRCGDRACNHPAPPAAAVGVEPVIARIELAAMTALDAWRNATIA